MKPNKFALDKLYSSLLQRLHGSHEWQRVVKSPRVAMGYLNRVPYVLLGANSRTWVLGSLRFCKCAISLYKGGGTKYLAIYLKACHILLMKSVAGQDENPRSFGCAVALRGRIPAMIPKDHRRMIRLGDVRVIRFWLTLFGLYRVVPFPGRMKISTITDPGKAFNITPFLDFLPYFWARARLKGSIRYSVPETLKVELIYKSAPGSSQAKGSKTPNSSSLLMTHASALLNSPLWDVFSKIGTKINPDLMYHMKSIGKLLKPPYYGQFPRKLLSITDKVTGKNFPIISEGVLYLNSAQHRQRLEEILESPYLRLVFGIPLNEVYRDANARWEGKSDDIFDGKYLNYKYASWDVLIDRLYDIPPTPRPFPIAKLGTKQEPGKVRVFAMVDWWTQMLLKPVHLHIQGILKKIPQDCTFDQNKGVREAIEMSKGNVCYSLDLSAATDRLPVLLQSILMNSILPGLGQLWGELLVDRDYYLPKYRKSVTYAVGQPMGALSSWVMLALTHHFIVQYAAYKVGWVSWFPSYRVLGDDVVIFDAKVAREYLRIMDDLGVAINMSKSLVSVNGTFEFAKRFIAFSQDASPLSFKELDSSMLSLDALALMLNRFGKHKKLSALLRVLGFGYHALARLGGRISLMPFRLMATLVWITKPNNTPWSFSTYREWLSMKTIRSSSPGSLREEAIWDALSSRIDDLRPTAPRVEDIDEVVYEQEITGFDYSIAGEGIQPLKLKSAVNLLIEDIGKSWGLLSGESTAWFEDNFPDDTSEDRLEEGLKFFEEWSTRKSSLPPKVVRVDVRKDAKMVLRAGRWLRVWLAFKKQ